MTSPNDLPDWTAPGQGIDVLDQSANNQTVTGSFSVPAGTQSVCIITVIQAGDESNFSLTGVQSGFPYYSQALGSGAIEYIGLNFKADQTVNWSLRSATGPGVAVHVTALPVPPPSFISRNPAPWEAPTLSATINWFPAAGTSHIWIPHTAGRRIRPFAMFGHWRAAGAGFGRLMGSGSTGVMQQYDQQATQWFALNYEGKPLDFGEDLTITNDDVGNGQNINGAWLYSLD